MNDLDSFHLWLERVLSGDQQAATELVRRFEPRLLLTIRNRLAQFRISRMVDPRDISQTVFGCFFSRAAASQLAIRSAEHLEALLGTMARNRVHDEARKYMACRRDCRIVHAFSQDQLHHLQASEPTPSKVVAGHELMEEIRRRFTEEERRLLEHRAQGLDWAAIAKAQGGQPEALRKKLNRAIHRVLRQLRVET